MIELSNNNYDKIYKKLNTPWVESPIFNQIKGYKITNPKLLKLAEKFNRDGYIVIDLGLSKKTINDTIQDIKDHAIKPNSKKIQTFIIIMKVQGLLKLIKLQKKLKIFV